jgi:hypothetical protein
MNEGHRHRTFTDRGSAALHRTVADVAGGKAPLNSTALLIRDGPVAPDSEGHSPRLFFAAKWRPQRELRKGATRNSTGLRLEGFGV